MFWGWKMLSWKSPEVSSKYVCLKQHGKEPLVGGSLWRTSLRTVPWNQTQLVSLLRNCFKKITERGIPVLACAVSFEGPLHHDIARHLHRESSVESNVLVAMWWSPRHASPLWRGVSVDVYAVCLWDEITFRAWIHSRLSCGGARCGALPPSISSHVADSVGGEALFECVKILVFPLLTACTNLDWYSAHNDKKFVFNSFNLRFDDWTCLWVLLILLIWCILWSTLLFTIIQVTVNQFVHFCHRENETSFYININKKNTAMFF